MALLPEPRLVIADEPTTALDVTIQAQILKLLRKLATELCVSVLFATHDLGTAWEICDRVTVMYAGQELETAPIANGHLACCAPCSFPIPSVCCANIRTSCQAGSGSA
jgi:ABC-type dipeptide/oligopeptide/nickel transport system ATPase component